MRNSGQRRRSRWGIGAIASAAFALGALTARPAPAATVPTADVLRTEIIGYSVQHRPITAYELGNPHAPFTAVVLGSMHGYFERAGETVTRALRSLPIPAGLNLWVIDTINPDGDALHQRGNAHDVDLNRNWPHDFTLLGDDPNDKFDNHFSGPQALSEPETRAMYTFLRAVKPNRMVSMHQPLDGVDTTDGGGRDVPFRQALVADLHLPQKAFTCFGGCHGSMTGWLTANQKGAAVTVEFASQVPLSYLTSTAPRGILAAIMVGRPKVLPHPTLSINAPAKTLDGTSAVITGQLTTADRHAIIASAVWLWRRPIGTSTWHHLVLVRTNAHGDYTAAVPVSWQGADYRATYDSASAGSAASAVARILGQRHSTSVTAHLSGRHVTGTLTDTSRHRPLAGSTVEVWVSKTAAGGQAHLADLKTDARGRFSGSVPMASGAYLHVYFRGTPSIGPSHS